MTGALGLGKFLEEAGHTLVVTSDKDGPGSVFERELPDADVVISQPFWPAYLTADRIAKAPRLKLAITAGIGSDHVDLQAAMNAGMTVAEVTYSNSILQAPLPDDYTTASPEELGARIVAARRALEGRLLILGHHYQRDEVIRWADARGDSLKLARYAAEYRWARDIVFCGVHFMAESADILSDPDQRVILPDLNAAAPWPTWPTPTTSRSAGKPSEA